MSVLEETDVTMIGFVVLLAVTILLKKDMQLVLVVEEVIQYVMNVLNQWVVLMAVSVLLERNVTLPMEPGDAEQLPSVTTVVFQLFQRLW